VAILGTPTSPAAALTGFRHLWVFAGVMAALSGSVSILLGPVPSLRRRALQAGDRPYAGADKPPGPGWLEEATP
jgi:hypothetical protein